MKAIENGIRTRTEPLDNHYYLKQITTAERQFSRSIRELVRKLWVGDIDEHEFYAQLRIIIIHGYKVAWDEGQEEVGALVFLPFFSSLISQIAARDMSYIYGFAHYIIEHNKANGGLLSALQYRTSLWANNFNKIKNFAKWQTGEEEMLLWSRHSKDGCSSCRALDGKVYTAKEWREFGIRPQHPSLACMIDSGGIPVCRCTLLTTKKPRSKGSFPSIGVFGGY